MRAGHVFFYFFGKDSALCVSLLLKWCEISSNTWNTWEQRWKSNPGLNFQNAWQGRGTAWKTHLPLSPAVRRPVGVLHLTTICPLWQIFPPLLTHWWSRVLLGLFFLSLLIGGNTSDRIKTKCLKQVSLPHLKSELNHITINRHWWLYVLFIIVYIYFIH